MLIDELAKKNANIIPNSKLVKYYEAAIPQYHMEVTLTLEAKKELPVLKEFILKFVKNGIEDIEEICKFIGVGSSTIYSAIADMERDGIVSTDINHFKIKLTNVGDDVLRDMALIVPEDIERAVFVDGLLGTVYIDNLRKYSKKDIKKFGYTSVRPYIEVPGLDYLDFESVNLAIKKYNKHCLEKERLNGNLLTISSLEKVYEEYNKVSVFVYLGNLTHEVDLRVYEKQTRRPDYENVLLQLLNQNTHIFDFDLRDERIDNVQDHEWLSTISPTVIHNAKEFAQRSAIINKEITQLQTQITIIKEQNDEEFKDNVYSPDADKIQELENKIKKMELEQQSSDRILNTYDHRPLLIKALTESQHIVIVVSPWIRRSGLNTEIFELIKQALMRKTEVVIGYGISEKRDSDEKILVKLNDLKQKKFGKYLKLVELNNTHEKVLIMDDKFLVVTSFNWLSFRGDPKFGFRQETGFYTETKITINDMKRNLSTRLKIKL